MMKETIFVLIILACCALLSCGGKSGNNISGFWYTVSNDTIYEESVLTNSDFWAYSNRVGEVYRKYEINRDSISFSDSMNKLVLGFESIHPNEFLVKNSYVKSHYYRIEIALDPKKVIQNNPAERKEYMDGLIMRKKTWKAANVKLIQ